MILIGENLHIISKSVKDALSSRNENFICNIISMQKNMDYIDLNVGPAKGNLSGILPWLGKFVSQTDLKISFDTTNYDEMSAGINSLSNTKGTILNSTSSDEPKLSKMIDLALQNECNLVALTMSKDTGIPKTADGRLELAFEIYEKCMRKGLQSKNIFFDPLILPICVDQSQAQEAINTIQMLKESFDNPVKTVVGLSNVSNDCPNELRPLINKVMGTLCYGAGLDAAIIDAKDVELVRILKMLETNEPQKEIDKLYLKLAKMVGEFGEIEDITFSKNDIEQVKVIKTAKILLNKNVYSNSFLNI